MKRKLKGAILGFGFIAVEGHLPAFAQREDVEISAVYDQNPERKPVAQKMLKQGRFYSSLGELFDREDLDFVDIATSPSSHKEYIIEALARGLNVLCEKPLVLKEEDLRDITDHPHFGAQSVFTVHNWKYAPVFQKASELIKSHSIGEVQRIRYEVLRTGPSVTVPTGAGEMNWRLRPEVSGGGILVDHGWHAFYTLWRMIGKYPSRVECHLENRKYKELSVEDTATIKIIFDRLEVDLFFTWTAQERKNVVTVEGTQGKLEIPDDRLLLTNGDGQKEFVFGRALSKGSHHPEWYPGVLEDFIQSVQDEDVRNQNIREAAVSLALMTTAQKSHQEGGAAVPLTLEPCFSEGLTP